MKWTTPPCSSVHLAMDCFVLCRPGHAVVRPRCRHVRWCDMHLSGAGPQPHERFDETPGFHQCRKEREAVRIIRRNKSQVSHCWRVPGEKLHVVLGLCKWNLFYTLLNLCRKFGETPGLHQRGREHQAVCVIRKNESPVIHWWQTPGEKLCYADGFGTLKKRFVLLFVKPLQETWVALPG